MTTVNETVISDRQKNVKEGGKLTREDQHDHQYLCFITGQETQCPIGKVDQIRYDPKYRHDDDLHQSQTKHIKGRLLAPNFPRKWDPIVSCFEIRGAEGKCDMGEETEETKED